MVNIFILITKCIQRERVRERDRVRELLIILSEVCDKIADSVYTTLFINHFKKTTQIIETE